MANKRISELPSATTPLSGSEEVEIVQGGINKKVSSSELGAASTAGGITNVAVSAGTLALDFLSEPYLNFDLTATQSAAFAITYANETSVLGSGLFMRITGTVSITLPSDSIMSRAEEVSGRWVPGTNVLTVIGTTASPFLLEFKRDALGNMWVFCSERGV